MKQFQIIATLVVLILAGSTMLSAQSRTQNGTWNQSIEKSRHDPGPQPKNARVRAVEAFGSDRQKFGVEGVAGNGNKTLWTYSASYDGKEYPLIGPAPFGATTIIIKHLGRNKTQGLLKNGDKVVKTTISELSKDGKTLTITVTGTNANGAAFTNILVFDRADYTFYRRSR
jgi:hypothetical protein